MRRLGRDRSRQARPRTRPAARRSIRVVRDGAFAHACRADSDAKRPLAADGRGRGRSVSLLAYQAEASLRKAKRRRAIRAIEGLRRSHGLPRFARNDAIGPWWTAFHIHLKRGLRLSLNRLTPPPRLPSASPSARSGGRSRTRGRRGSWCRSVIRRRRGR
jgi:hypothetical protein